LAFQGKSRAPPRHIPILESLPVYKVSIEFLVLADTIGEQLPKGRGYLSDQLLRAATSIPLNIAEGAGEYSCNEKGRFYRMAKRSASECVAIIDACYHLKLVDETDYVKGRELLDGIFAMLTKLAQGFSG
jgi:four helix bundle protein